MTTQDNHTPSECPICKTQVITDSTFCSSCGYDFVSGKEGAGPFSFAFANIQDAYKPSGKSNTKATAIMLSSALFVGIAGGAVLTFILWLVGQSIAAQGTGCFNILLALIFPILAASGLGYLIGLLIGSGSQTGKCRNVKVAQSIGVVASIASVITYAIVRTRLYGSEAYDSAIDVIRVFVIFVATVIPAWIVSADAIRRKPFCENCEHYMKNISIKFPIRYEADLMDALQTRMFARISDLTATDNNKAEANFSTLTLWHCENCRTQGFINAETTQKRIEYAKNEKKEKLDTRRVFSTAVSQEEMESLMAVFAKFAQPTAIGA